jgi:nitrous oxidase accessory protein NosD
MVSDLSLTTGLIGSSKLPTGTGLLGALTVSDVPQVRIERVAARCPAGAELGVGAIVVRQTAARASKQGELPPHACIADCELLVGAAQLGILCVDFAFSDIRGNRIHALDADRPPERGIVVAGSAATEVRIAHNTIVHAAQGIALGLSRSEQAKADPLLADRVLLTHNTVTIALSERDSKRNRFGLFVGNAQSLLLDGNRVSIAGAQAAQVPMEAIRLSGAYGLHLVVRANHMSGTQVGIAFTPLAPWPDSPERCVWLFDGNLAEQAGQVIACEERVRRLLRSRDNLEI